MKLYAVHKANSFEQMKKDGYLTSKEEYFLFPNEYKYMIKQMESRIKGYKYEGDNLLWFWNTKPDLSWWEEEKDYVLISIDVPKEKVLISHYDHWHAVLNNAYYIDEPSNDDIDDEYYYDRMEKYFKENHISEEDTWYRIFDDDVLATEEMNQVTTGKIPLDELTIEGYYRVTAKGVYKIG